MPCHALLAGHTIPLCVVCVGFALQCRFCWAIFLENSGDVTRMIPRSDVNGCPSHKIPSHHNHILVLYNRRSSYPTHGTEATSDGGARPSGEFWLHAGLGDQTVGSETWETGTRNRLALEIESHLILESPRHRIGDQFPKVCYG